MKLFFVKRGDSYWQTAEDDLFPAAFWSDRSTAQYFLSKTAAFYKLNNAISSAEPYSYAYRKAPELLKKESYKVVSLKGRAALEFLLWQFDSRLGVIETTLKEHRL